MSNQYMTAAQAEAIVEAFRVANITVLTNLTRRFLFNVVSTPGVTWVANQVTYLNSLDIHAAEPFVAA
jgi:hypothetical protein